MSNKLRLRRHLPTVTAATDRPNAKPCRIPAAQRGKRPASRLRCPRIERLEDRALLAALPPADLVSWWRAENSATDFVGGNNGTLVGGATFTSGEVAQGFRFDASMNAGVLVPASPSLNPTEAITIEAWVKPSSYPNSGAAVLRKDTNSGGTTQYSLNIGDGITPGTAHFNIGGFAGVTGGTIPLNVWTHVAGTYDRHLLRLYVNGVEVAATPATQAIPTAATNLA